MEFNIGDKVRIKDYTNLTDFTKNKGVARIAGKEGVVIDKLYSEAHSRFIYRLQLDGYAVPSNAQYDADSLSPIEDEPVTYCHEFDYLENIVIARFYKVKGGVKTEIMRGHGHIIHEGDLGVAQASSYALKKIYEKMEELNND